MPHPNSKPRVPLQPMKALSRPAAALLLALPMATTWADERTDLLEMKNTILNLVDALVEQGILTEAKAQALKNEAAARARADAARETVVEAAPADEAADKPAAAGKVVRVPYVPNFVKDEIREQVRAELRKDVTADVVAKAKEERWGLKDALPAWVTALRWSGDARLRYQGDYFASSNPPSSLPNFQAINEAGGITRAGQNAFLNSTEDRHRTRVRARLALDATVADNVDVGLRFVTGRLDNPISLNETLGRQSDPIEFNVDRLWIGWNQRDADGFSRVFARGGRIPNPYFTPSDVLWDNDLAFEGFAVSAHQPLWFLDQVAGPASPKRQVFLTLGAFPLLENELPVADDKSNDKWLWGGQAGIDFAFTSTQAATVAFAFHDYINVPGQRNQFNSVLRDWTAPRSVVKGNTLYDLRNDLDLTTELFGLAADFTLINLSMQYRYSGFDAADVWLTGEIVKNIGYDEGEIARRTGVRVPERSLAWHLGMQVGNACDTVQALSHCVDRAGEWTLYSYYRYLQRDSMLDAFTDSNFNLGGTNTQGYVIGADYGLTRGTWLRTRWMSSDEIDGVPFSMDVLQVDVNANF